jgi:hypothetical protein
MSKQKLCLDFLHKIQLQIVRNHQALIQKVPFTLSIFKKMFSRDTIPLQGQKREIFSYHSLHLG